MVIILIKQVKNFILQYREVFKNRNVALLIAIGSFQVFWLSFLAWFTPIILYDMGGVELLAATYMLIPSLSMFFPMFSGTLTDLLGRKAMLIVANALLAVSMVLMLSSLYLGAVSLLIGGIILKRLIPSLSSPAESTLIIDSASKDAVGKVFSIMPVTSLVTSSLGGVVWGYLAVRMNIFSLLALTTIALIMTVPFYFLLKETGGLRRGKKPSEALKEMARNIYVVFKLGGRERLPLTLFMVYLGVGAFIASWIAPYFAIYLLKIHNLDAFLISITFALCGIGAAIGNLIAGPLVDRYGPVNAFITQTVIEPFMLLSFAFLKPPLAIAATVISSSTSGLFNIGYFKYVALITDAKSRATTLGALETLMKLARIPGPALGACLWGLSPQALWTAAAIFYPLTVIPILFVMRRAQLGERSQG